MSGNADDPGRQFAAAWQAAAAAVGEWRQQIAAATAEARGKLDPALRAAMEAGRAAFTGDWRACHCPCRTAHPDDSGVCDGSAVLTHVHHRQTPLFLMQGRVQAGVTWQSEAMFQEQIGHPISHVEIPADQNATAIYAGAEVRGAAHPGAAKQWLEFIRSPEALHIFERYGFKRYQAQADK